MNHDKSLNIVCMCASLHLHLCVLYVNIQHTLTYEVQEATEINSLMRANTAITRMMTNYCRLFVLLRVVCVYILLHFYI